MNYLLTSCLQTKLLSVQCCKIGRILFGNEGKIKLLEAFHLDSWQLDNISIKAVPGNSSVDASSVKVNNFRPLDCGKAVAK